MPKILFHLVAPLLGSPKYFDISRDEIERFVYREGVFDRVFDVDVNDGHGTSESVPVRLVVQRKGQALEQTSIALLLHDIRIDGIDFEGRFTDLTGERRRGWHRHIWDSGEESAERGKQGLDGFDACADLAELLTRAFKELRIQLSGKDYGEPSLPLD